VRLIDLVAQCRRPFLVHRSNGNLTYHLRGAMELAGEVGSCPMRYLLTDELARVCAGLAYSSGDRLVECLDLIRVPATSMWVEWSEAAELTGGAFIGQAQPQIRPGRRSGAYISSAAGGRQARLCSFWSDGEEALASPFEAALDFDAGQLIKPSEKDVFHGGWAGVTDTDPEVADLLSCVRFRLEPSWANYYCDAARSEENRAMVLRDSLGGVARGVLMVLAFLLLLVSSEGVSVRPISWETLNRKRAQNGKLPLLDHLEAALALSLREIADTGLDSHAGILGRVGPRRHHVRGHLVRRQNRIFWRRPHLRGSSLRGNILSRTVTLSFDNQDRGVHVRTLWADKL
jgi:hypothetical protein